MAALKAPADSVAGEACWLWRGDGSLAAHARCVQARPHMEAAEPAARGIFVGRARELRSLRTALEEMLFPKILGFEKASLTRMPT